jgi:hypothetical protein
MLKRGLLVSVLAIAALFGATPAQAKRSHHFSVTAQLVVISRSAGYPALGSSVESAGILKSTLAGNGAQVQTLTITGHPTATTYTFKGTSTDFYSHGTLKSRFTGTATVHANGSASLTGSGHYTGGTDRFRRASGKFTVTGSAPAPVPGKPQVVTAHATGRVFY